MPPILPWACVADTMMGMRGWLRAPACSPRCYQVESGFATGTARQVHHGMLRSTRALEQAIRYYLELQKADLKPFTWT